MAPRRQLEAALATNPYWDPFHPAEARAVLDSLPAERTGDHVGARELHPAGLPPYHRPGGDGSHPVPGGARRDLSRPRLAGQLWVVTAFTVGHSITLALAVTGAVRLPTPLIEFLIPVTIVGTGLENLIVRNRRAGAARRALPADVRRRVRPRARRGVRQLSPEPVHRVDRRAAVRLQRRDRARSDRRARAWPASAWRDSIACSGAQRLLASRFGISACVSLPSR